MKKMILFFVLVAELCFLNAATSSAKVIVSNDFSEVYYSETIKFESSYGFQWSLYKNPVNNDYYEIVIQPESRNPKYSVSLIDTKSNRAVFHKTLNKEWHYFVKDMPCDYVFKIYNLSNKLESIDVLIFRKGKREAYQNEPLRNLISVYYTAPYMDFRFPSVDVIVKPCGAINAYASDKIILCTEIVNDLYNKKQSEALAFILYHEMGHYILEKLKLPGYDNEDFVDEFAAFLLLNLKQKQIIDSFQKYIAGGDVMDEFISKMYFHDRHSFTFERVRNLNRIMNNGEKTRTKWIRLFDDIVVEKKF